MTSSARTHFESLQAHQETKSREWFHWFACECGRLAGKPVAFILASAIIALWAVSGPIFRYSDTWQLVINTGTTIITFLMVFLIQHSQNRDTLALQVKLSELILAVEGARNKIAAAEDLDLDQLERIKHLQDETASRGGAGNRNRPVSDH